MKNAFLFALLFLCLAFRGSAQQAPVDSSGIMVSITMPAKHYYFLVKYMHDDSDPEVHRFIQQIAQQTADTATRIPAVDYVATVECRIVAKVYRHVGLLPEYIASILNSDMKDRLMPQIVGYSWLFRELVAIQISNQQELDAACLDGLEYCKKAKL